jgi:uncharacterized protein YacL
MIVVSAAGHRPGQRLHRPPPEKSIELERWWPLAILMVFLFFAGVVGVDVLTPSRKLSTLSAIVFGCIAGLISFAVLNLVIDLFIETYEVPERLARAVLTGKVILVLGLCYLGITTILQTQDDFRLVIPYVEFAKQYRGARPLVLDTSVLIDGRILPVGDTGVLQAPVIVPRCVIDELQLLSDRGDPVRRRKGRRGLEVLAQLQRSGRLDVTIDDREATGKGVDQQLIDLAETIPADLVTTDFGLNRVASIHGVRVINLNELAGALKSTAVPGQTLRLMLIRAGEHEGQAVGYLEDGAMVIAEDAAHAIGQEVGVRVTNSMQTAGGRLIFGQLADGPAPPPTPTAEPPPPEPTDAETAAAPEPAPPQAPAPDTLEASDADAPEALDAPEPGRETPLGPHSSKRLRQRAARNPRRS